MVSGLNLHIVRVQLLYVSLNVEHFAAQISRVEALGQSRSKSSFPRIGREAIIG